jgi:hypothetical protein
MTRESLGAIALLAMCVAVFWLIRRYAPAATCPHCGSTSWILLSDTKQCRACGSLFQ